MDYSKVYHRFWKNRTVRSWDDATRSLAVYLLTCQHSTSEGYYHLPIAYAAADLGWPVEKVEKAFGQLDADDFARYDPDAEVVLVCNAVRWNPPRGENQEVGAFRQVQEAPASPLLVELWTTSKAVSDGFGARLEGLASPFQAPPPPPSQTPPGDPLGSSSPTPSQGPPSNPLPDTPSQAPPNPLGDPLPDGLGSPSEASSSNSSSSSKGTSPNGDGADAPTSPPLPTEPDEPLSYTQTLAVWAEANDEHPPDVGEDRVTLTRWLLDVLERHHPRSTDAELKSARNLGRKVVVDFLVATTGQDPPREIWSYLGRLISTSGIRAVFDAVAVAVESGAGLTPPHNDDPLSLLKYATAVKNGKGSR